MEDTPQAFTVSAITRMIKDSLEDQFQSVWVEGEISSYHHHSSGHRYITLKDSSAVLKTVMWRSIAEHMKFDPEVGQKVLAFGSVTVYERGGNYQLTCKKLVPVGVGPLEIAFRQLHEKLTQEGLFEDDRKKPIPKFPEKIGIVTSPTGAAVRDIIQIAQRRNSSVKLVIYPAAVQGEGAEQTIADGIDYLNEQNDIDLIIIGRGGGSLEDLWAFNTEITVRAIAKSNIPIVSAVGHEIDTTLSDLVADMRAPTPSAASELTVWSSQAYMERVNSFKQSQSNILQRQISQYRTEYQAIVNRPVLARPLSFLEQHRFELDSTFNQLSTSGKNYFDKIKNRLSLALARLDALSPLAVLARGYSFTQSVENQKVLHSAKDVQIGDKIESILAEGSIISDVIEKIDQRKK